MTEIEYYEALKMAVKAHDGIPDNDGLPSIIHPARVAEVFAISKRWELALIAVLHDTVEDTSLVYKDIEEKFGYQIAYAVAALTRIKDEKYFDYIKRVAENRDAAIVKEADIRDNLYRRGPLSSGMKKRYLTALNILNV